MKGFFGTIAIIGLIFAGADHPEIKTFYIVNIMAAACFLGGMAGLLMTIRKEE